MRRSFIISLFLLLLCSVLAAQTSALFTTYLIRDDNAFKTREAYDEWINNSAFQIGHQFSGDDYRLEHLRGQHGLVALAGHDQFTTGW